MKGILFSLFSVLFGLFNNTYTNIIPGGENIGIEIKPNGVVVIGGYDVNSDGSIYNPLKDSDIKKGDLVFFHTKEPNLNTPSINNHYPGHVGIYIGDKSFIHVLDNKITINKIEDNWLKCLVASRDLIKKLITIKTMF